LGRWRRTEGIQSLVDLLELGREGADLGLECSDAGAEIALA
jgi:hypothetical protein